MDDHELEQVQGNEAVKLLFERQAASELYSAVRLAMGIAAVSEGSAGANQDKTTDDTFFMIIRRRSATELLNAFAVPFALPPAPKGKAGEEDNEDVVLVAVGKPTASSILTAVTVGLGAVAPPGDGGEQDKRGDVVEIAVSKFTAIDMLNALVVNMGSVPAGKGDKGGLQGETGEGNDPPGGGGAYDPPLHSLPPSDAKGHGTLKKRSAPLKKRSAPLKKRSAPLKKRSSPLKKNSAPLKKDSAPLKRRSAPLKKRSAPLKKNSSPLKKRSAPLKKRSAPLKKTSPTLGTANDASGTRGSKRTRSRVPIGGIPLRPSPVAPPKQRRSRPGKLRGLGNNYSAEPADEVDCTAYAPGEASPGNSFLVQVFAHLPEQAAALEAIAKEADPNAKRRVAHTLDTSIKRGSRLTFDITMPDLEVDEPSQSLIWRGRPASVQFAVTVPKNSDPRDIICTVIVSESSIPIGHLKFTLKVIKAGAVAISDTLAVASSLIRYRQAFISYASADRAEVLKRVQMLNASKVKFFQDLLTLEPGDNWEKLIYQYIDESDVFYLFWSKAASKSRWVKKEIAYARKRQAGKGEAPPEILPILIEGPPPAKPPKELSFLHFNDTFLYFIKVEEALSDG